MSDSDKQPNLPRKTLGSLMKSAAESMLHREDHHNAAQTLNELLAEQVRRRQLRQEALKNSVPENEKITEETLENDELLKPTPLSDKPKKRSPGRPKKINIIPGMLRSKTQKLVYAWIVSIGAREEPVTTTIPVMSKALDINERTLRRILQGFCDLGILEKKSNVRGLVLRLTASEEQKPYHRPSGKQSKLEDPLQRILDDAGFAKQYPELARIGFTYLHLQRVIEEFKRRNLDQSCIHVSLRYAEYELLHGLMVDSHDKLISSPVDWIFRCLITDGTYRIPRGFVHPEERQRILKEKEIIRKKEELEKNKSLMHKEIQISLEQQAEEILNKMIENPQSVETIALISRLPHVIRERGELNDPVVRSNCYRIILDDLWKTSIC